IDEAHHLPEKTQSHFSLRGRLNATVQWLERLDPLLAELHTALQAEAAPMPRFASLRDGLQRDADNALQCLRQLHTVLQQLPFSSDGHGSRDPESATHRFALGVVPEPIAALAAQAVPPLTALADGLSALHEQLAERVDENDPDQDQGPLVAGASADTSSWLGTIGALQSRAANSVALLHDYALGDQTDAPHARWVNRTAFDSELVSTPMEAGGILERVLWSSCHAAICTSATLTAGGRFDRFLQRAGLPAATTTLRIPSPFDYPSIATLHIPAMRHEPSATQQHDQEVAQRLPELLGSAVSALLLFSSWRQLNAIIARLPDDLRPALHVQGEQSKQALLDAHHARIDQGLTSYLAGVASFAEGLDLPDDYCRHVIIVKLPFAAPDAPLDQAMAEWVEARGGNAFYEIAVPDAALRLVQACGRLIRHEGDHGRITLLDRRIVSRRYGRTLLASLPPYRLVVEPADPRREPATPL
ncbi:MAG: ATP-dependent DNA helicase DinG, partial [Gammaproteobacteria bacterium]|nr:ATP-dependent DNA helicase DinG [Gammaproteobacteria bacterium]